MKQRKRWVPFWLLPASWGLKGKIRELAEAEYYYDGDDLQYKLIELGTSDPQELELKKLEYDFKQEKIGLVEYEKKVAEIKGEPYVNVVKMGLDEENVVQGYFELDWNDHFVKYLQDRGITGRSDEDVVNKWFNAVCRTVLMNEERDLDYGMQDSRSVREDVEYRTTSKD